MDDFGAKCLEDDVVKIEMEELEHEIDVNGVSDIEDFLRKRLEKHREVEVNIAITGNSGAGKSSFINAIRGLRDDDHKAAKVGSTQTTLKPTPYDLPTSPNILLWDLPGISTPNYPDLEAYVQNVQLEKYDTFLILTCARFTIKELLLAEKIKSMQKSFFFIRTKIDVDVRAGSRLPSFNENAMLMAIRRDCAENLGDLLSNEEDLFLISNHE
ncbi:PREDICTED: interferon-inducible GTPase 5-like, partial [Acropora digitifera]|uniref:interferon-inducible GTPase 5-like n=1 Tax=Acropora digitifera TaxID=70779 RepID=UPI00077A8B9F